MPSLWDFMVLRWLPHAFGMIHAPTAAYDALRFRLFKAVQADFRRPGTALCYGGPIDSGRLCYHFSSPHSRITVTAMTNSRLRIDLSNGLLEVEGDEGFVRDIYKDFKDQLAKAATAPHKPQQHSSLPKAPAPTAQPPAAKTPRGKGKPRSDYNGKLDKNLDLSGGKGIPSLKDYLKRFDARSLTKKDTVFIKYLQEFVGIEKVNVDHIYTCYDDVGKSLEPCDRACAMPAVRG